MTQDEKKRLMEKVDPYGADEKTVRAVVPRPPPPERPNQYSPLRELPVPTVDMDTGDEWRVFVNGDGYEVLRLRWVPGTYRSQWDNARDTLLRAFGGGSEGGGARSSFNVGDKVKVKGPAGSFGIVHSIRRDGPFAQDPHYYVLFHYGRRLDGTQVTAMSGLLAAITLEPVTDETFATVINRRFNSSGM